MLAAEVLLMQRNSTLWSINVQLTSSNRSHSYKLLDGALHKLPSWVAPPCDRTVTSRREALLQHVLLWVGSQHILLSGRGLWNAWLGVGQALGHIDSQEVLQPAGRRVLIEQPGRKVAKDPEAVEPKLELHFLIS